MRYLLLFLAIPFLSAQAEVPNCTRLKEIAGKLEKQIQEKRFPEGTCDKIEPKSIGLNEDSIGFPKASSNTPSRTSSAEVWDYRCKDLSAIDLQLKSIENEMALLNGIDSLKKEIETGLKTISKYTEKENEKAKQASKDFMENLVVAKTLETFLATNNAKGENILGKVTTDPDWKADTNLEGFKKIVTKHCKSFPQEGTICAKGEVNEETYKEIQGFVAVGSKTEDKFNKKQIKSLTEALSIKIGDEDYSYTKLAASLKGPQANGLMAEEDVKIIAALGPISNNRSFDFLKGMKKSIDPIKDSASFVKAEATPKRFTELLQDLKSRQEWEVKSKLSLVFHQYGNKFPSETDTCVNARELKGSMRDCLAPMKDIKDPELKSFEKSAVEDLINEFEYGERHIARLDTLIKTCIPQKDLVYPADCEGVVTQKIADLSAKAQVLNTLRAEHIKASPELIAFRDYALAKLHSGECLNAGQSNIRNCDQKLGNISLEAVTLTGAANDIIYVFNKPKEDNGEIEKFCSEGAEKVPFKEALCALKDEEPSKGSGNGTVESFEAPVSPGSRNTMGPALFELGSSILNTVAGYLAPPATQPMNPYGPASFPYTLPPARDGLDSVKQSYPSFGTYYPTPGLMPYSSVKSNVGVASAYSFGASGHFNAPVGW